MRKGFKYHFKNLKLRQKLIAVFLITSIIAFGVNLFVYVNLNRVIKKIDAVYSTNISLNDLSDNLDAIHSNLTGYLETKGTDELELYYKATQDMARQMSSLNSVPTNNPTKLMEYNIRSLLQSYMSTADEAISSKRGRDVAAYTDKYNECQELYGYLSTYIYSLNNEQFKSNSNNYSALLTSMQYSELLCLSIFVIVSLMNILLIVMTTSTITRPLTKLSEKANEISERSPENVEPLNAKYNDEIGNVTRAFNQMLASIKDYIEKIRTQMENESVMKEKSLLMETHLKDAQLKYLQAQINPHFLFNTLNAGAQLAMMEGADRTGEYIRNMADFFRYNVKKNNDVVSISEEIELVDSYIYILDVRFAGDIKFSKEIDSELLSIRMPSMIIQPIVENSVKHGLANLDENKGEIKLSLYRENNMACIRVSDDGIGMEQSVIDKIMAYENVSEDSSEPKGIGIANVMSRLHLFYNGKEAFEIQSTPNVGTSITIKIPME